MIHVYGVVCFMEVILGHLVAAKAASAVNSVLLGFTV